MKYGLRFLPVLAAALAPVRTEAAPPAETAAGTAAVSVAPAESWRFAVLGDNQPHSVFSRQTTVYGTVLDQINGQGCDLAVNVGDIVAGAGKMSIFRRQVAEFVEFSKKLTVPYYVAYGNHDLYCDDNKEILTTMVGPLYQSFSRRGAHFILLNTDLNEHKQSIGEQQLQWLEEDLRRHRDEKPIFVFLHRPVFPCEDWPDNMDVRLRQNLHALFRKYGVAAVFSGHQHFCYREEHDGIRYYITGGAGGPLLNAAPYSFHHWLLVTVAGGDFRVDIKRIDEGTSGIFRGMVNMQSPFCTEPFECPRSDIADRLAVWGPDAAATAPGELVFARAHALQKAGEWEKAFEEYGSALAIDPALQGAMNNRAVLYARGGLVRDAEALLRRIVKENGKRDEPRYNLALLLSSAGDAGGAKGLLREGLAKSPDSALLHLGMGLVEAMGGEHAAAEGEFTRALALDPGSRPARMGMAESRLAQGDTAAARTLCDAALSEDPGDRDYLRLMAAVLAREGKYYEAAKCYTPIVTETPRDAAAWVSRGNMFLKAGRTKGAISDYSHALSIDADLLPARYNMALAQILGDMKKRSLTQENVFNRTAFSWLQMIVEQMKPLLSAEMDSGSKGRVLNNWAVLLHLGGLAGAETVEQYLNRAISAAPDLPEPRINLGNLYWEDRNSGKAGLSYLKALKCDPASSDARYNLATLLVLEGKLEEGIGEYRKLLSRDPAYYRGWNSLADVCMYRHGQEPSEKKSLRMAADAWRNSCRIRREGNPACDMLRRIEEEYPGIQAEAGRP